MWPSDVYVVWDQQIDRIYSVHSSKEFADKNVEKLTHGYNIPTKLQKYTVATLEQAQGWMTLPFKPDKE